MAESKYGKYIVTELKPNIIEAPWSPVINPERAMRIMFLDNEVVEGAFYVECVWIWPWEGPVRPGDEPGKRRGPKAHKHDYDEVIAFMGTNPDDPHDLCAEVELWLGDEKHVITKSCMVFIPKGLQHCPLHFTRVDRPVFHFTSGPGKMYF